MSLSKDQTLIVDSPIGEPIQVLASAGSGKTRVLTARVRHVLDSTRKDGVITLTFTNKAAEEIQYRLKDVDGIEERIWASTIHGVAQRILDQYGHTIGLPSELHIYERDQDRKTVFIQSLRDQGIDIDEFLNVSDEKTAKKRNRIIQNYMEQFSIIKRNLWGIEEVQHKYSDSENFPVIYQAYQTALLQSGGIDFDDILVYAHKILVEQPWCCKIYQAKFKHIFVDEAQDLNKAQYELIKVLCGETIRSLMMVGDPNQMIYGFNGSSHEYLCNNFIDDFSPQEFTLKENYRSSKAVVRLANKLKSNSQVETEFALEGYSFIVERADEESEAIWVVNKIKELLEVKHNPDIEGDILLNKMVVIARNRFVFKALQNVLTSNEIPYSLNKGERQAEPSSLFGKVLDSSIRIHLNSKDWVDGKKLCSTLNIDLPSEWGGEGLLQSFAQQVENTDLNFSELISQLLIEVSKLDSEEPKIPKFYNVFKSKIETIATQAENNDELALAMQELKEFYLKWSIFKRKGLGKSLLSFQNAKALGQLAEKFNPDNLILSTVHTMKGLEKDIVFLVGMCEGVFPDYRATTPSMIDEEQNNAFVAVTRSKRWIYITYPISREMPWGDSKAHAPSRFIKAMKD